MKSNSQARFKLSLEFSGFPLRLAIVSILGVGATAIVLGQQPDAFALLMVLLSAALIVLLVYLLYPALRNLSLGFGLLLAWYVCMLVPGIVFLALPWIEPLLPDSVFGPADYETTRIYLWTMGLFVTPIDQRFPKHVHRLKLKNNGFPIIQRNDIKGTHFPQGQAGTGQFFGTNPGRLKQGFEVDYFGYGAGWFRVFK